MDIPVYLIAGFLDSGKTGFINGILRDGFAEEDRTLLICCEEGELSYDPKVLGNVFTYTVEDEDDLTPATRENLSLDDLKKSWIARANTPCIFLSARMKTNIEKFRTDLYGMVREIHAGRYPFNNFLY